MSLVKYSTAELRQALGRTVYTPEICITLMEHMAEGLSLESFCGRFLLSVKIVKGWIKAHKDFEDALEIGRNLQRYQWEKILLDQSQGLIKANPAAMIFALKNYFPEDFQDKREVAITASQIVIDTGIGHRENNDIEEAEIVEAKAIDYTLAEDFDEEDGGAKFVQSLDSMFEDDLDCL